MKCCDCGNTHPALPGFPNHVLCDYYHLHMSNSADASRCEHFKSKVLTNADLVRSMTDNELAKWVTLMVCKYRSCGNCPMADWCTPDRGISDWLKAPVEGAKMDGGET